MTAPDPQSDPQQWVDEYFLRDFTEQEMAALEAALADDPALRARFIENMNLDLELYEAFHQAGAAPRSRQKIVVRRAPKTKVVIRPRAPRQPKRPTPWLKMAASLLLLLGAGLAYIVVKSPEATQTVSVQPSQTLAKVTDWYAPEGDPVSAVHSGVTRTIRLGDYLREGERVSVPDGGRLDITYLADFTTISFDPGSTFRLLMSKGANGLELSTGCLMADVAEQQPGRSFRLLTDDAEIVVLGTRFEIRNEAATRVSVASGSVQVDGRADGDSVLVPAGYFVESDQGDLSRPTAFEWRHLTPTSSATLPKPRRKDVEDRFITVDPERKLMGRLDFDIPPFRGRISEARLKLRVMPFAHAEVGGEGTVRLKMAKGKSELMGKEIFEKAPQIGHHTGRAAAGMDMVFILDPTQLSEVDQTFLLGMDPGGDDFWFAAQESAHPPELRLTIVK